MPKPMIQLGDVLISQDVLEVARFDPTAQELTLTYSGIEQIFTGPDAAAAWAQLQKNPAFNVVGDGDLLNPAWVEMASLVPVNDPDAAEQGPPLPPGYGFRINGRNHIYSSPGNFNFGTATVVDQPDE